jgi:DNA-binding LacI/PurR family transcriptional regulator
LAQECVRAGTPVVVVNRYAINTKINVVRCDSSAGGRIVADAFLDAGHKRLAYIAGDEASSTNRDRETGFVERLKERGSNLVYRESAGAYMYEPGFEVAKKLLSRNDPPDAIFCANDLIAMGALDAARWELGIKVPEDLSIIGFDDIASASWHGYRLTTVKQPVRQLVDNTIQVLMDGIHKPGLESSEVVISPSIIWRNTSRRAKSFNTSLDNQ